VRLPDRQSSDGIAGGTALGDGVGARLPEIIVGRPLDNRKQHLLVSIEGGRLVHPRNAPVQPTVGQLHGLPGIPIITGIGRTFIKGHDDVSPDDALDVHRPFRREQVRTAIDVAPEGHALLLDFSVLGQAVHLIPSGIGQDGPVPAHEPMQSSRLLQDIKARTKIQVVGVPQNDVRVDGFGQHILRHRLDGTLRANRHERGGAEVTVRRLQRAGPGLGMGINGLDDEGHGGDVL
jgi:hypothetical protein